MEELEKLIQKAEARIGKQLAFNRNKYGQYCVIVCQLDTTDDRREVTYEQAIARLKELATPKDITVTIPYQTADEFAGGLAYRGGALQVADIIRKELKRVETE